jgi:hypothetical protein
MVIAVVTNTTAALWENYLMWRLSTDSSGTVNGFYLRCNNCSSENFGPGVWDCAPPPLEDSCDLTGVPVSNDMLNKLDEDVTGDDLRHAGYICQCQQFGVLISWTTLWFWLLNGVVIVLTVGLEITLVGLAALRASAFIADTYHLTLTPLNEQRAFVARSFIRATFELGSPSSALLGVDPASKSTLQQKLEITALSLLYLLKVVLLALAIKVFLWSTVVPLRYYTWLASHAPTVASIFWDLVIGTVIMDQVERRAHGVIAGTEVFNELLSTFDGAGVTRASRHKLSLLGKIQVVRAIGVAIVAHGSMYPTMELLLRHAIQYLPAAATLIMLVLVGSRAALLVYPTLVIGVVVCVRLPWAGTLTCPC